MNAQDFFTAFDVWVGHLHLPVETTRTQKGRVKNIGAVGRRNDDNTFVGLKAVHLNQKLVQGLLAFIIAATIANTARAPDRVNLVNKDDTRRVLFGLLKHIAHAACADTHEHLDKVRARDGKEGHTRLASDGACKQGLTRSRRADKQRTLGDLAAKLAEFLRIP